MEWWFNFDLICWSSMSIVSGHSFAAFNLDVYRHWSQGNQLQWLSLSFIDYQFPLLQTTQHMLYIYIHAYSTFEYYILILSIEISLDLVLYYSAILILYLVLYCLLILFMFPESPCRRLSRKRPRRRCRRRQRQLRGRGRRRRMRSAWRLQRRRPVEREVGDLGMDQYLLYHF